jgi:subtilisin family serine protease
MANSIEDTIDALGSAKVIVSMKSTAIPAGGVAAAVPDLAAQFVKADAAQENALGVAAFALSSRKSAAVRPGPPRPRLRVYEHLGLMLGFVDKAGHAALARDERVAAVYLAEELSLIRPTANAPAKPQMQISWGLERLGVPLLWQKGLTGEGIEVGHLDTGVDGTHPALSGAIAEFAEFDMAGNRVPGAAPWDSGEHGTHTAGTIAARPVKGNAFGMAPKAQLATGMVIEGGQVIDRVLAGMDWLVERKVRILSMSLGLRGYTPAFETLIQALRDHNVLPVIAAGNEGPDTSRSPGNYPNVLSVGACDKQDKVADFSSSQNFNRPVDPLVPDLVGPGVEVLSCTPRNTYQIMSGTSMATPHVAGLAALLLQAKPNASAADLEQAILGSCQRPASMPAVRANRGVPDGVRALTLLTAGAPLQALAPFTVPRPRRAPKRKPAARRAAPAKQRQKRKLAARPRRPPASRRKRR